MDVVKEGEELCDEWTVRVVLHVPSKEKEDKEADEENTLKE